MRKYGPSVDDIAQQYGISGTALLAKLVVGESGDNAEAVSPAGARGRTQFMPGSRQIAVDKYGVDPWADEDQAVHAAALHLRGKINGTPGLEGYNPGMPTYPQYILNQKVGDVRGRVRSQRQEQAAEPRYSTQRVQTSPGVDNSGLRRQLVGEFLQEGGVRNPNAVMGLAAGYGQAQDTPATYSTETVQVPGSSSKRVKGSKASGAEAALAWAEGKLGDPGSAETSENRGPLADYANKRFGMQGQPWCAMFTSLAVTKGGAPKEARTASVAEVRRLALEGKGYERGLVDPRRARPGDLVLFGDRHIGMVRSVKGGKIRYVGGNQSDNVTVASASVDEVDVVRPRYGARR